MSPQACARVRMSFRLTSQFSQTRPLFLHYISHVCICFTSFSVTCLFFFIEFGGVECERQSKWSRQGKAAGGRIYCSVLQTDFLPSLSRSFSHHYLPRLRYHCSYYHLLIGNIIEIIIGTYFVVFVRLLVLEPCILEVPVCWYTHRAFCGFPQYFLAHGSNQIIIHS